MRLHDEPSGCTGLTAIWCPVHGDCLCEQIPSSGYRVAMSDPRCPLHAPESPHPVKR